jgi:hypothetical protein
LDKMVSSRLRFWLVFSALLAVNACELNPQPVIPGPENHEPGAVGTPPQAGAASGGSLNLGPGNQGGQAGSAPSDPSAEGGAGAVVSGGASSGGAGDNEADAGGAGGEADAGGAGGAADAGGAGGEAVP